MLKAALLIAVMILFGSLAQESRAAIYTVDTSADDGALTACTSTPNDCSLGGAVANANSTIANDTIEFAIPLTDTDCTADGVCTITLGGTLLISSALQSGALQISNSSGAKNLLISGNNAYQVFLVNTDGNLTLNAVTVTNDFTETIKISPNFLSAYKSRARAFRAIGKLAEAETDEKNLK